MNFLFTSGSPRLYPSGGDMSIETHGNALVKLVSGLGPEAEVASRLCAEHGLSIGWDRGTPVVADWYPVHQVLAILNRLGDELGEAALFRVGLSVPMHAAFPAGIDSAGRALRAIDIAYHMSHRKNGAVMFDAENGMLEEGIGCYVCSDDDSGMHIVDSASLYPCAFDCGVIAGLARRFEPNAEVEHLDGGRCRRRGSWMCTYVVTW